MDFKNAYPDYAAIEKHIRRARVERSLAIALFIADAVEGAIRGLKGLFTAVRSQPLPSGPRLKETATR